MTVSATTRKAGPYTGNGVATSFSFAFKVFATTDVQVVKASTSGVESTLVLNSDYSVTLNADQNASPGGSIAYPLSGSPLAAGEKLAIVGSLDYSQTTTLPSGGAYSASVVERALDRLAILAQQILEIASRGVRLATTAATNVSASLPSPVASSVLGWNNTGTSLQNYDAGQLGVAVSYANWSTQTFNGTGAQTDFVLTLDAGVASNCDVTVGGVSQTPGVDFSYTAGTKTISFLTGAPPTGTSNVVVRYGQSLPNGAVLSASITDASTVGKAVLTAASAAAARTTLGSTAVGDALFVAASQSAARTAIGTVPSSATPSAAAGAGAVGASADYARADHVHPAAAAAGSLLAYTQFNSSATWTRASGTTKVFVEVLGGGGNGGAGSAASCCVPAASGGGGGQGQTRTFLDLAPPSSCSITVGGASGASTYAGGTTVTAAGGVSASGGAGGSGGSGGTGGNAVGGLSGSGSLSLTSGGLGGGNTSFATNGAGTAGPANSGLGGCGGGGSPTGGAGGTGRVRIWEYA